MIAGLTLDAGVLIGVQRNERFAVKILEDARRSGRRVTVPAVAIAESWRGGHGRWLAGILDVAHVEEVDEELARRAGELLARTGGDNAVDAIVAVSAARRGDIVATSDPDDLLRFAADLRTIRVWSV